RRCRQRRLLVPARGPARRHRRTGRRVGAAGPRVPPLTPRSGPAAAPRSRHRDGRPCERPHEGPSVMTRLVLQLHAGFVLAGMGTTLLGPVIPILTAAWGLDDREAGRLFAAQFGGALTATSVSALVARRIGAPRTLAAGFLLFAAGIGAIGVVPREAAIAAALTFGLGQGLVLPLTNIAIATLYPARPAGALSL